MMIRLAEGKLRTKFGTFSEMLYYNGLANAVALTMGDIAGAENVLCRVHSSCLPAHAFNSIECDCREQMEMAQFFIEQNGAGAIIWLEQEGRGNGLLARISSANLKEQGLSQSEAYAALGFSEDARNFAPAVEILRDLQVKSITLLTNNPQKAQELAEAGIAVAGVQHLAIDPAENPYLLQAYRDKINRGHAISLE